jgi:O-antigen ligase
MSGIRRAPLLPPGWIVFALFVLNPVFWAMGLGGFIWAAASIPLIVWILLRHDLALPPATSLFVVYVVWAGFSVIMLDSLTRVLAFSMRYGVYLTAIGLAVYVYNERRVTRTTFINWVSMLWVWAIIGGYLGLLLPRARINVTPASLLLPGALANNDFVGNLVRPRFAQVQNIFGVDVPRPSTLWAFTNEWGGNVGLLTPFFIIATLYAVDPWRRRAGIVGLIVAAPVMIISVNRGLWLSVGMILAVAAVRSFLGGRTAPLKLLAGSVVILAALLALTPIGAIVAGRLSESSADSRTGIYQEAWEGALESPILGWGGPRPSENPFSPSVGTHGHMWFAMFSHGLVGLVLYVGWLVNAMYLANRRRDPVSIMLATVVYVGALQMFFYNMFAGSLPIILIAIGLLFRSDDSRSTANRSTRLDAREFEFGIEERAVTRSSAEAAPSGYPATRRRVP